MPRAACREDVVAGTVCALRRGRDVAGPLPRGTSPRQGESETLARGVPGRPAAAGSPRRDARTLPATVCGRKHGAARVCQKATEGVDCLIYIHVSAPDEEAKDRCWEHQFM